MTETPMAARPKIVGEATGPLIPPEQMGPPPKRGPGRPPKPETADPFTVMTLIASALRTVDKPVRRQILETLLAVSE